MDLGCTILGNLQHASESVRCTSGVAILRLYFIGTHVCRVLRLCFVTLSETTQAFSWVTGILATHEARKVPIRLDSEEEES